MIIRSHQDLDVYKLGFECAMEIFEITKSFPLEEKYSLTDQIKRSSRSVCSNIAEAFRKRKYPKSFVSKLSDAEGEAAETQVWLHFSYCCKYMEKSKYQQLYKNYDHIIGKLVNMSLHPEKWNFLNQFSFPLSLTHSVSLPLTHSFHLTVPSSPHLLVTQSQSLFVTLSASLPLFFTATQIPHPGQKKHPRDQRPL